MRLSPGGAVDSGQKLNSKGLGNMIGNAVISAAGAGGGGGCTGTFSNIPEKLFVIKRDKDRPYKRLDKKYQMIANSFLAKYEENSQRDYANFNKMVKMVMQVTNEIDIIKGVVENMQYEVDQNTVAARDKTADTQKTVSELLDAFKGRIKNTESECIGNHKTLVKVQKMVYELQGKTEK